MKTNQKGFTLIELLVVIAIIGILAGIVLVSLGGVRDRAAKSSLQSTMASVTTVAAMCEAESYDVQAPVAGDPICLDGVNPVTDIAETYPTLPTNVASDYDYGTYNDATDTLTAVTNDAAATVVVSCNTVSGSCSIQ